MLLTTSVVRSIARSLALCSFALFAACAGAGDPTGPSSNNGGGSGGGTPAAVASRIDLSASTIGLGAIGASENVSAMVRDANGNLLSSATVSWTSSDITVADVSGNGANATITARAPGRTTIRASSGNVSQELQVNVSLIRAIELPAAAQARQGSSITLTPTLQADEGADAALRWESADPTIASVSGGVVTGVRVGVTTVRVSAVGDARITAITQFTVSAPRSVVIRNAPTEIFLGDDRQLDAALDVDENESQSLSWSSSSPTVAAVSSSGRVIAVGLGTAIIRVQSNAFVGVTDSVTLQVRVAPTVSVSPSSTTFGLGQTRQLVAQVQADGASATVVLWRSANPAIAMVSSDGLVTGVSQGTATITAVLAADTTRRGTATVTIVPLVRDVEVQPSAVTLTSGEARQLAANVTVDDGASQAVTWRTSNAAVASVSATGMVTGIAAGSAIITATSVADSSRQSTALITVRNAPTVTVSPTTLAVEPGEAATLVASVQVAPGVSTAVTWRTSDASVVSVSAAGQITGVSVGTASVTAVSVADTTRRATSMITVRQVPRVQSISVVPSSVVMQRSQTAQLTASVVAIGGATTGVTYRSDNPAVASVNFTGLVTALATGSATITVTANADPARAASVPVVVTAPAPPPPPQVQLATNWASTRLGGALYENVVSFDAIDASSAFAVNSVGDVFRLSGGTWTVAARGASYGTQFLSVSATSASNAVAVGTNGVIVRFNGSSWSVMNSGVTQTLNDVFLDGTQSGFAVGFGGVALRLNAGTWSTTNTGSTQSLNGVWVSGTVAYAVGANGEALRWNGTTWTRQSTGTTRTLFSVAGISGTDVMAVGSLGTVLRSNGSTWTAVVGGAVTDDLYDVQGSTANSNRYYVVGDRGVYSVNGSTVSPVTTPYAPRLSATSIDGAGNVWASGQRGIVQRLSAGVWETLNIAPDLIDVWSTSTTNAWAVGEFGFVYRWNGSTWARQATPTTATLNTVWGASSTDAFAGGENGTMLRWNGSSWSQMTLPSAGSVYGLWGSSASNVYAAMSTGEVLRFNGSSWSVSASSGNPLWAVFGSADNDVYATGENGTVMRFNGTSWSSQNVSTSGTIAGVWSGGASNVLTVGAGASSSGGISFANTGGGWSALSLPTAPFLTSVWGASANDVYATGDGGTILRWNGSSWSPMSSGTSDQLWAVSGAPAGNGAGFAVGYNSTLVAGTSSGGLVASGYRALTTARSIDLDPRVGAQVVRGPLPEGAKREMRKRRKM